MCCDFTAGCPGTEPNEHPLLRASREPSWTGGPGWQFSTDNLTDVWVCRISASSHSEVRTGYSGKMPSLYCFLGCTWKKTPLFYFAAWKNSFAAEALMKFNYTTFYIKCQAQTKVFISLKYYTRTNPYPTLFQFPHF